MDYTNEIITSHVTRLYLQGETEKSIAARFGDECDEELKQLIKDTVAHTKREKDLRRILRGI